MICPDCQTPGAYQGATPSSDVECLNEKCDNYSERHAEAVHGPPPPPVLLSTAGRPLFRRTPSDPYVVVHQPSGRAIALGVTDAADVATMLLESYLADGHVRPVISAFYDTLCGCYTDPPMDAHEPGRLLSLVISSLIEQASKRP